MEKKTKHGVIPYDKSHRYKKHIGNKSEGQGFAEFRKKKIKRGYRKLMQKQEKRRQAEHKGNIQDDESEKDEREIDFGEQIEPVNEDKKEKLNRFSKARAEFEKKKEEERQKKEEALKEKAERDEAIQRYNEKKKEKHNKFKKRTNKGQPLMKYRIQDLLEQIKTMKSKETKS